MTLTIDKRLAPSVHGAHQQMHGVHQQMHGVHQQMQARYQLDVQVEELRSVGYTTVASGLSAAELTNLRDAMEAVYQTQLQELGGLAALKRCNDLDTARCPLAYDERFIGVASHPALMALMRRLLGENFVLLQQNGLFNRPGAGHFQTHWHRDLSFQHGASSEPIAINALLTLDDFTLDNGCTHVLPASHLRSEFPSDEFVARFETPLVAPAGTFLVLDAMLFHRAGRNLSSLQRRAVNHLIGRPFMAQQFDLSRMARRAPRPRRLAAQVPRLSLVALRERGGMANHALCVMRSPDTKGAS